MVSLVLNRKTLLLPFGFRCNPRCSRNAIPCYRDSITGLGYTEPTVPPPALQPPAEPLSLPPKILVLHVIPYPSTDQPADPAVAFHRVLYKF